jgi:hypothetical protein
MAAIRHSSGKLYADIIHDEHGAREIWIYIVQQSGSPEILEMGSCATREAAEKLADESMRQMTGRGTGRGTRRSGRAA